MKPALIGKVKSQACDDNSAELWAKTCAEAEGGLLIGPLTEAQVDERFGSSWVPVRRFAVLQSSQGKRKLRPIGDFSENRINVAFGCADKLDLRALDEITGVIRIWTSVIRGGPVIRWRLSDGSTLEGKLHAAWSAGSSWVPRLTTLDLKQAYKQFAISEGSGALGVIALKNPSDDRVHFFVSKALPFGSAASVLHFNRLSRLFWRLGLEVGFVWANFYDDYPVMTPAILETSTARPGKVDRLRKRRRKVHSFRCKRQRPRRGG